jgi:hypothetical protein
MLKAGTPVVLMLMLSLSGVEYMSPNVGMSTLLMAFGTGITSMGELNWHTMGFTLMLLSTIAEAGRCVMTQHILKVCCAWKLSGSTSETAAYLSILLMICGSTT